MNKIVVIANERFEKGLVAFINSYKKANMKSQLAIIDTGLKNSYPYETVKINVNELNYKKAPWMKDCSPYLQLELANYIDSDNYIYLEADMLLLKNIDHLFNEIEHSYFQCISVMDDAAKTIYEYNGEYIDRAGRYFIKDSELYNKYKREKGYNGGLIGGSYNFYKSLGRLYYDYYLKEFEDQYRLLSQSLLNQFFIEEGIIVKDVGLEYNFSGINEYYDKPYLYNVVFNGKEWEISFNNFDISILHFTGKNKPFFNDEKNVLTPVWEYFYNKGELF